MQRADVAMYVAKETHSGFEVYSTDRDGYSPTRLALASELRQAIENEDLLKIDKSFVMAMTSQDNDAVIVRLTVDLGRNLGLRVVAEGVETIEMFNELKSLGCDIAPGVPVESPVPAAT